MRTFISELLAVIISVWSESLLRNIWQPSVLSIEMVGTVSKTLEGNERKLRKQDNETATLHQDPIPASAQTDS